jgi:hypothetical protein
METKIRKTMKKWHIHVDHPWSEEVKEYGAPLRAYIRTPWRFIIISLWPGNGSQVYDWKTRKYTDKFSWLVFRPLNENTSSKRNQ